MAYEFKKLSDVEVVETPTETANVLIEEDGVIKKAPKTAVGGAGEEFDMVVTISEMPLNFEPEHCSITAGSMQNVIEAISERRVPKIKIIFEYFESDGNPRFFGVVTDVFIDIYGGYLIGFLFQNWKINLYFDEYGDLIEETLSDIEFAK